MSPFKNIKFGTVRVRERSNGAQENQERIILKILDTERIKII
jgi:hypothetical protein